MMGARRFKTRLCKYHMAGHCPYAATKTCQFAHSEEELRAPPAALVAGLTMAGLQMQLPPQYQQPHAPRRHASPPAQGSPAGGAPQQAPSSNGRGYAPPPDSAHFAPVQHARAAAHAAGLQAAGADIHGGMLSPNGMQNGYAPLPPQFSQLAHEAHGGYGHAHGSQQQLSHAAQAAQDAYGNGAAFGGGGAHFAVARAPAGAALRASLEQKRFTKLCKYFIAGHCPFSASGTCQFAHSERELRRRSPPPQLAARRLSPPPPGSRGPPGGRASRSPPPPRGRASRSPTNQRSPQRSPPDEGLHHHGYAAQIDASRLALAADRLARIAAPLPPHHDAYYADPDDAPYAEYADPAYAEAAYGVDPWGRPAPGATPPYDAHYHGGPRQQQQQRAAQQHYQQLSQQQQQAMYHAQMQQAPRDSAYGYGDAQQHYDGNRDAYEQQQPPPQQAQQHRGGGGGYHEQQQQYEQPRGGRAQQQAAQAQAQQAAQQAAAQHHASQIQHISSADSEYASPRVSPTSAAEKSAFSLALADVGQPDWSYRGDSSS
ncbi:hypothetical protein M885DRAFT_593196 [Pelagophyceae sp. CCMP2097]|nr:hypothetical protein M885DRAFT_593196 [Pelagophyceae sp. CCMP2097]